MQDRRRDPATSNVLAWASLQGNAENATEDETVADVDEPPDNQLGISASASNFKRSTVLKTAEPTESLLTRALHQSEDEIKFQFSTSPTRRRSMNSSISLASTADLTSDTGFTSPARTNTPSPPPPVFSLARNHGDMFQAKRKIVISTNPTPQPPLHPISTSDKPSTETNDSTVQALKQKRCISFACGNPQKKVPAQQQPEEVKKTIEDKPQRKSCIRFACPTKVFSKGGSPKPQSMISGPQAETPIKQKSSSPITSRKHRSPSVSRGRQPRSVTPRPVPASHAETRTSRYLTANAQDLNTESSHFHEFASDEPREEDWIKQNPLSSITRLTINDTLRKENEIRRLGKEAEEEALEEEAEEEGEDEEQDDAELDADDDDDDQLDDANDSGDEDGEDDEDLDGPSDYCSDGDASDGYNTDNEIGFADSDDEDDENLQLWTPSKGLAVRLSEDSPINRRLSFKGDVSDSSSSSDGGNTSQRVREKRRRIKIRPGTPELPDSTDFVCGTLDEDRALEDAYISCVAARRREKLHLIPQDIDPSFPTSEPEEDEDVVEPVRHGHDSDDHLWIHGELEDLHHTKEQHEGDRRKKKGGQTSPRRYHSPPPKCRGRSPRRLFDRHSPRRVPSPAPCRMMRSPPASLVQGVNFAPAEFKTLAFRPGLTHTKSLPRAPAMFPQHVKGHRRAGKMQSKGHMRGAIDIVKGLEQKRQRRTEKFKEKYLQKHCHKARKGQVVHTRPQPGQGAQRMREIGLLSAGKVGAGPYVLSV